MPERTEQEQLAQLVGQEEAEPIVTGDILAEGLKAQLGDVHPSQVAAVAAEIESQGDVPVSTVKKVGQEAAVPQKAAHSEKVLLALYDVRDNLIKAFEGCSLNSNLSECLTDQINKIGSCIVNMGGNAQIFEPLNHVSGLEMPDVVKNAEEVIQRTIQCYKLGAIKEAKIKDDGREISIVFEGKEGETTYTASGRIIAKGWTGNEAIDYVYTPRSGKMSVKAFEGGRWVTKSDPDNDDYHISWELSENEAQDSTETSEVKQEVFPAAENNISEIEADGEEDIGSPIK